MKYLNIVEQNTILLNRHAHIYIYIYIYIIYIYIYYTHLPVNAIARVPHPRSADRKGQETFLASFVVKNERSLRVAAESRPE